MRIMAIIPARKDSKGVINKNKRLVCGKELFKYTFDLAEKCDFFDKVVLTTNDQEIIEAAANYKIDVPYKREEELAGDSVKTIDVVLDVLKYYAQENYFPDAVMLLQITAPMRSVDDVKRVVEMFNKSNADSIVSVEKVDEPHPYKMKSINEDGEIKPFIEGTNSEIPRQLLPEVYKLNGCIYLTKTQILRDCSNFFGEKSISYIMKKTINIDCEMDLKILELVLSDKINLDRKGTF